MANTDPSIPSFRAGGFLKRHPFPVVAQLDRVVAVSFAYPEEIIGSETDRHRMVWLGNLMTGYHYRHVKVAIDTRGTETRIHATRADDTTSLDLAFDDRGGESDPPP